MSEQLSADLNIIQSAPIELELLDGDLNIIQKLDDEPNDVGGLTSAELKAKFDESGNIIKKYINETLIPAVLAEDATEESRKQAEAARVAAEQTRQTNEETRQSNEAARQNAESQRVSAENARNVWEDYSASKAYAVGNKVAYGGSSYLCIKPCTGIAPPNAEYWRLIAAKGNDGKGAPSDAAPKAAGTANAGVLETYSRGDHVHPKEVSDAERTAWNGKQDKITGTQGQVVMINAQGAAEAQDAHFGFSPQIVVTAPTGSTVTCTKGSTVLTASEVSGTWTFDVPDYGIWVINAVRGGESASDTVGVTEVKQYNVSLAYTRIYGVSWAGTSATTLTRTDDAAGFADPVPALSNGSGSSPFDSCMPWSGMVKENRTGGVMVKIPKFWYKITQNGGGVKIQIADGPVEGFSVSPAHMDRGDGKGERDYVYVGRYHCASDYKSKTGVKPVASITRSSARSSIHNLGTNIWQCDFAMRFTIWLLYIVEFADWDSQTKIGYGCGNNSATENMGYTDSMQYHTGTTLSSRTTYGASTQYRWIEGLLDNVYDWCDGCYYDSNGLNIILNPSSFSDGGGGTLAGSLTSGYPSALSVKSVSGLFPVFVPSASSGSNTTYVPDYWNFNASLPCLLVGGNYNQNLNHGMFYVNYNSVSNANANIGCRHLVQKGFATRSHYVFHARMDWHPSVKISKQDTL